MQIFFGLIFLLILTVFVVPVVLIYDYINLKLNPPKLESWEDEQIRRRKQFE